MYSRSIEANVSKRSSGEFSLGFTELRAFFGFDFGFWITEVRSFRANLETLGFETFNSDFDAKGVGDCFDI
jgi:hypothetical protein